MTLAKEKSFILEANARHLKITVDVEPVVLAGKHDGTIVHKGDIETLGVLHLALQGVDQGAILRENGQVEVVVVVGDEDLAGLVDADADRIVGDALASDLPQVHALVVEYLDAVRPIVADENLLFVVDDDAVGEL